jgi:isopentenyl-diphosphate delta-isomerase
LFPTLINGEAMKYQEKPPFSHELAQRKEDHIQLALKARTESHKVDSRFSYEPMFFSHPGQNDFWKSTFLGFDFHFPIWISSMTGGTHHARMINENLARLCGEFRLGMGLGSCRSLLESESRIGDFAVKKFMGSQPLFANIGIAQVEELIGLNRVHLIHEMVKRLEADGLIIHINPLQEWFQPEGDRFKISPLVTLETFLEDCVYKVIVKEVGQGMGPKSLKALLELPLAGIELGAFGGTNFSLLEKMRAAEQSPGEGFINVGHTAEEMVSFLNALPPRNKEFIISGGIKSILDGYYLKSTLKANSLIGMASAYLDPALKDYETLKKFFLGQREALLTARGLLQVKEEM